MSLRSLRLPNSHFHSDGEHLSKRRRKEQGCLLLLFIFLERRHCRFEGCVQSVEWCSCTKGVKRDDTTKGWRKKKPRVLVATLSSRCVCCHACVCARMRARVPVRQHTGTRSHVSPATPAWWTCDWPRRGRSADGAASL